MIFNVYAIFDRVAQSYGEPFLAQNNNLAQRRFNYVMQNSPMVANDTQLFKIGEYNTDTAILTSSIEFVCNYTPAEDN